ncbi:sorbitol dehydrogenase [Mollisia scopiformis]|uniref:D-xylulose reductase n=1 Tax=Mollisia scopiformis TaxID=149040 RepID=A0A194X7L2_MOLSC|nr:sorbitol dehydrogenase [Mollisia scopiformis]KUJ16156.1 sorbitol dehydrogenase [Mollisia scopiformis]
MSSSLANPSCYLYGPGDARIEESVYPTIEDPHDVVVRIAYVGVCGSDVHFWSHGGIVNKVSETNPIIMGHEASGIVHEIGSAVSTLKIGDKVAIEPGQPCRRCKACKAGHYNLCSTMKFAADPPHSHGALRRYFKMPEDYCYKLPSSMGLDEGVLVEPLAVAVHVARLAEIKAGQDVVVFGAGTVGFLCAAVAKAMGAKKIISVDVNGSRLKFAKKFAATGTFLPSREDSAEDSARKIIEENGLDEGADAVLEATGVEICIETGIYTAKRGGTFIQAGLGKSKIQFPIVKLSEKEINMKGCFRYNAGDYELAMHFLESGKISVKELISSEEPFERATYAWDKTKRGEGIKNLIRGPQD